MYEFFGDTFVHGNADILRVKHGIALEQLGTCPKIWIIIKCLPGSQNAAQTPFKTVDLGPYTLYKGIKTYGSTMLIKIT